MPGRLRERRRTAHPFGQRKKLHRAERDAREGAVYERFAQRAAPLLRFARHRHAVRRLLYLPQQPQGARSAAHQVQGRQAHLTRQTKKGRLLPSFFCYRLLFLYKSDLYIGDFHLIHLYNYVRRIGFCCHTPLTFYNSYL